MSTPTRNDSGSIKYTNLSSAGKAMGSKGGKSNSEAKVKAARENGKQGGGHTPK